VRVSKERKATSLSAKGERAMFVLEVLSGPLDGKTWPFEREITIGRDDGLAEACIGLDRYVSRRHAQLRASGETLMLTDLESRNGTKLDGKPVDGDAELALGMPFVVGRTVLRVTRA
jgi:pSer/pThr/pTyr-binding forkhead associated (FHA) protein